MITNFRTKLVKKETLTTSVIRFRFEMTSPRSLHFTAGQYMILIVKGKYRQYSIASPSSTSDAFEIVVDIFPGGLGSEYLKSLNEGDEVFWKGPAGVFVLHSLDRDKVFITTGTGIAPVRSMIASAILESTDSNPSYTLFWGQRTAEDAYFKDEFEAIAQKHSNFAYTICLSRERELKKGEVCVKGRVNSYVTEYLRKRSDLLGRVEFYLCGSKSIVDSLKTFLEGLQVPTKNIYFEKFV